jgi:replication factor C subunit 2/4
MTDIIAVSSSAAPEPNKENVTNGAAVPAASYQIPWVEKYRPRTLDDVLGNADTVHRLRAIAKDGNVPNLILCGPPGTGKTTSVHALARELLGSAYRNAVLELNASDARGIDVCVCVCAVYP